MVTVPDVLVLGEPLVELSSTEPFARGAILRMDFSGDALNAAAASAAAGARTALLARVPDDGLGDALVARAQELGVDCSHILRVPGQHGLYLTHLDPDGRHQFVYARAGSAGSGLGPDDVDADVVRSAAVVLASGVTCAISPTAADAVKKAARLARTFVYDPNFRPRLTTAGAAGESLRTLAPLSALLTPSWPDETAALLGVAGRGTPEEAAHELIRAGADAVAVTCGEAGVVLVEGRTTVTVPSRPAPDVVDQTGAGDSFVGTVAGRLASGEPLDEAVRWGVAAASLSVQGRGGTGYVPTEAEIRAAL